jgi:hypothetical protein
MIVSFALTGADFCVGFRLPSGFLPFVFMLVFMEDVLRGLPDWAEFVDLAGRAPGLFLSP